MTERRSGDPTGRGTDRTGRGSDRTGRGSDRTGRGSDRAGDRSKPLYMIGVVAEMLQVHPQTLRFYEKKGLLSPSRTEGRTRMYSEEDVEDLARLIRLTRDLGVNLAGVEIILKMRRRMSEMQKQIEDLVAYLSDQEGGAPRERNGGEPREALVRAAAGQLRPLDLF